jgi:phage terminase large subunit-like protein
MTTKEKLSKLREGKWSSKYFCKLALLDHLREYLEKDNYLKATDTPKSDKMYDNLDKELMDLKIILDLYFEDSDWYTKRIDKFYENLEK